jgi:chromosomal replication initiator protein
MGSNNRLAFSIAQAVAENPGRVYNPFFIYSGVGLGKTHLMQAIGNKVLEKDPKKKVLYCTSETFTNELIDILRGRKPNQTTTKFREKYRHVDVLIIDDIQFLAGKESTQEEFFHTFNALYMSQKQIVIASDRPPRDFKNIEERITSRFGSGIIADIQRPDLETRIAILRNIREIEKQDVSDEALNFVAQVMDTNIRELEGAYRSVWTFALNRPGQKIDENLAREALGQMVKASRLKPVNLNQILKVVSTYFGVTMTDVKGKRRTKELVIPRHIAMYLMYEMTQTPYMSIGEFLGGRDHTTVMHGVDKVGDEVKFDAKVKQNVENIKQIISREDV